MTDWTQTAMIGGMMTVVAAAHASVCWMGLRALRRTKTLVKPIAVVSEEAQLPPAPPPPPRPVPVPMPRLRRPMTLVFLNRDETDEIAARMDVDGLRRSAAMTVDGMHFHAVRTDGDTVYYRQL